MLLRRPICDRFSRTRQLPSLKKAKSSTKWWRRFRPTLALVWKSSLCWLNARARDPRAAWPIDSFWFSKILRPSRPLQQNKQSEAIEFTMFFLHSCFLSRSIHSDSQRFCGQVGYRSKTSKVNHDWIYNVFSTRSYLEIYIQKNIIVYVFSFVAFVAFFLLHDCDRHFCEQALCAAVLLFALQLLRHLVV